MMICFKCQNSINSSVSKYCMVILATPDGMVYSDILETSNVGTWHVAVHMNADRACDKTMAGYKGKIVAALGLTGRRSLDFLG